MCLLKFALLIELFNVLCSVERYHFFTSGMQHYKFIMEFSIPRYLIKLHRKIVLENPWTSYVGKTTQ